MRAELYIAGMLTHPGFFLFYAKYFACKHISKKIFGVTQSLFCSYSVTMKNYTILLNKIKTTYIFVICMPFVH
ncbi:hypothetical protein BPJM79_30111 [Bacillus pumilus]